MATESSRDGWIQSALLDNIPDMAWLKDRDSRYLAVSTTYLEALGGTADRVIGRMTAEVWPSDIAEVYLRTDRAVLRSGRRRRYEECRRDADGQLRWYDTIKSPIRNKAGRIVGTVGISRDITERKASEEELLASRAQLRKLSEFEQRAREEERARIARELHDELGQTLTAMKLDLVWLRERLPAEPATGVARLNRLISIADQAVVDLRRIATELRPIILDELGLHCAIEWLAQSATEHGALPVQLVFDRNDCTYDPDVSTAAFRIVQEALTNVVRHSRATSARIAVRHLDGLLLIEVSDDGCGINSSAGAGDRLGLAGMRERARLLGGSVEIDSSAVQGTAVTVRLPFKTSGPRRRRT
ncbi:PAS domain-containing sensor histidine kinase [Methylobacterium nigriterrae]|uniref:PAS domain-containing sensor histidine kinase n=1 Tax=Methylobacterium nigriterrae TaxID=3127512 RepID=UPI003013D950